MKMIWLFLVSLLLSAPALGFGDSLQWTLAPHYGFIVPHTAQMTHLIQGHSYGFQLTASKRTTGKKAWERAFNFPYHGIDFLFLNTGNVPQLGYQMSLTYQIELPLNKGDHRKNYRPRGVHAYKHSLSLGLGSGYATRIWDLRENHQAAVIGSHVNVALVLQYRAYLFSSRHLDVSGGIRITHFSNGAFQLPNLGTNNASVYLAMRWHKPTPNPNARIEIPQVKKAFKTSLALGFGLKEIPPPTGKKYITNEISLQEECRLTTKSSVGIGFDFMYNSSIKTLLTRISETPVSMAEVWQAGITAQYILHFNVVELRMQQGFYLRNNWTDDGKFYHRFGLRYFMNDHFFLQLMLKTHFAKADYGLIGCGYTIGGKR